VHHIVIDFWSLAILLNELGVIYPAEAADRRAALHRSTWNTATTLAGKSENAGGPRKGERLWGLLAETASRQVASAGVADRSVRGNRYNHRGGSYDFVLGDELSGQLKLLAKAQGATLYVVMLGGVPGDASYLSGQTDLVVGLAGSWQESRRV